MKPLTAVCALALAACGGSSPPADDGGDDPGEPFALIAIPAQSGEVRQTAGGTNVTNPEVRVGFLASGDNYRAFVTFDITQFNENDNVNGAGLSMEFVQETGTPIQTLGELVVEAVDVAGALDDSDFDLPPLSGATTLNKFNHVADIGLMLQDAISAGRPRITLRLRLPTGMIPAGNFVTFLSGIDPDAPGPRLTGELGEPSE